MGRSQYCTLMLRNVPNRYTKVELLQDLAPLGFKNGRDMGYVHLPMDNKTRANRGYAFVTLKTDDAAARFHKLEGQRLPRYRTKKILEVTDGDSHVKKMEENDQGDRLGAEEWFASLDNLKDSEMTCQPQLCSISTASTCSQAVEPIASVPGAVTTYMIRNVRNRYSQEEVLVILGEAGMSPQADFDFFYLPMNPKTGGNFGYGFINFTSVATALNFLFLTTVPAFFQEKVTLIKESMAPASVQGYEATMKSYQHVKAVRGDRARPQFWKSEDQLSVSTEETCGSRRSSTLSSDSLDDMVEDDDMRQLVQQMVAHLDDGFDDFSFDFPSAQKTRCSDASEVFAPMKIQANYSFFDRVA